MCRLALALLGVALSLVSGVSAPGAPAPLKPRVVVLTDLSPADVEPDDTESLVRLLVYADQLEIEGLVATTGWSTSGGTAHWTNLIHDVIGAYEKDLPLLRRRSAQEGHPADEDRQPIGYWPSAGYLRARTMVGSQRRGVNHLGAGNDSPGSEWIVRLADEDDVRPLWVLGWGGGNTLAQALWRVQRERTPEQLEAFLRRLRFYAITDQDRGYEKGTPFDLSAHGWMRREFGARLRFLWDESAWTYQNGTGKANWARYASEIQGHGHLGRIYPKYRYGVEGDTPSFLYVLPNGLNAPEHPGFGGWGGWFQWGRGPDQGAEAFVNQQGTAAHPISRRYETRFYPVVFDDFAARMDWAKDGRGNRNPRVVVEGDAGLEILRVSPAEGSRLTLDASASSDPEGDRLGFAWWWLPEAGTWTGEVRLTGAGTPSVTLEVPRGSAGTTFHVICEVTDDGAPPLRGYRRVIVSPVRPEARP